MPILKKEIHIHNKPDIFPIYSRPNQAHLYQIEHQNLITLPTDTYLNVKIFYQANWLLHRLTIKYFSSH